MLSDAALLVVHDEHFHEAEVLFGSAVIDRLTKSVANCRSGENKSDERARLGDFSGVDKVCLTNFAKTIAHSREQIAEPQGNGSSWLESLSDKLSYMLQRRSERRAERQDA